MDEQDDPTPAPAEPQGPPEGEAQDAAGQPTGVDRVDTALEALGQLDLLPVDEHAPIYEQVHEELRRALDREDDGDGGTEAGTTDTPSSD